MVNVTADFHTLASSDNPVTRVRIYTIADTVDCTDDNDVQTNGTLLVYSVGDTDSNGRIGQNGISVTDYYNQEQDITIGKAVSSQFNVTFLNDDGGMNNFPYGRFKAYLDVYDATNSTWESCSLGVYTFDTPTKRRIQLISAVARDQMQAFDAIADDWFNNLDFTTSGLTLYDILSSMASELGVTLKTGTQTDMINGFMMFNDRPFTPIEMTYREILEWIAEANCSIARFNRDGFLELKWFTPAIISGNTYTLSADTLGSGVFGVDKAEYTVPAITGLVVRGSQSDIGVTIGTTDNLYEIVDNGFMYGADDTEITAKGTPIYNVLSALQAYDPIDVTANIDWSIESGDVINFVSGNTTYSVPIFQQTITWRGGYVRSELFSSGLESRPVASYAARSEWRANKMLHELEINSEQLRSLIQDIEGNYSQITQTVNNISNEVSDLSGSVTDILDPNGEIWTFIKNTQDEVTNFSTYIRFTNEPAIILGTQDSEQMKLKLLNNVIYFFQGSDDQPLSAALASFDANGINTNQVVADNSVQVGDNPNGGNWVWHILDDGSFALDLM